MLCEQCKQKLKPRHSDNQRGYYRMLLGLLADECGYSGVQGYYIGSTPILLEGKTFLHGLVKSMTHKRTSTTLDKEQYAELIETVLQIGQFLGIALPPATK